MYGFREDFDPDNERVAETTVKNETGEYWISTVDLGLDHSFGEGPPLWYETMIFPKGEWGDLYCARYTTRDEAIAGHKYVVEHWEELIANY